MDHNNHDKRNDDKKDEELRATFNKLVEVMNTSETPKDFTEFVRDMDNSKMVKKALALLVCQLNASRMKAEMTLAGLKKMAASMPRGGGISRAGVTGPDGKLYPPGTNFPSPTLIEDSDKQGPTISNDTPIMEGKTEETPPTKEG